MEYFPVKKVRGSTVFLWYRVLMLQKFCLILAFEQINIVLQTQEKAHTQYNIYAHP